MKNLGYNLSLAVSVLLSLFACNKVETASDGTVTVNYIMSVPQTKASQADVNYVWYAQYKHDTEELVKVYPPVALSSGSAVCPVTMVRDQSYKVVFIAQHYQADGETLKPAYTIDAATSVVSMPVQAVANSGAYDLFAFVDEVNNYQGGDTKPVTLERLAAQINFYCNSADWSSAASLNMTPTASAVKLEGVPQSYDVLAGQPSAQTRTVDFAKADLTGETNLLGTATSLVSGNITKATLTLYKDSAVTTVLEVDNVPAEINYKTNVTGTIMTGIVDYKVELDTESEVENHPLS